jgi:acetoin utilization deacetylase AcuC-like enzyme
MGSFHPEAPARLSAMSDHLIAQGLAPYLAYRDAPLASFEQLLRVHSAAYLQHLQDSSPEVGIVHLDPDTAMCPHTWQAALRAAGAGVLAVDLVMAGEVRSAFCAVRPPGHHAERAKAMGFCFFNNIAVAVAHALTVHKFARVAIVDFDVHHGNGTEHCFQGNEQVLMVGTFQHPFYPYSGTENPAPNMLSVPLPAGADGVVFRRAMSEHCLPRLREFAPEMIFISAGFDAHYEDGLGNMKLLEKDYAWVTEQIKQIADETAQGRIVAMLEGGYALSALARSVAAHIRALAGI